MKKTKEIEREGKSEEEEKARKTKGDCRRRLRGVYDLFWKMVPQKAALKIHNTHTHSQRRKQWNSHSHNHIHINIYVRTYQREQGGKGKERKSKRRERSGAGLGEVTNNKYTHTHKQKCGRKDWMKIISNYLGREGEGEKVERKRQTKQEVERENKRK